VRVLSKNTVSPIAIAATIESASSARALGDGAMNTPAPAVASTQTSRSAPPKVERTALIATEPSSGESERTSRLVAAQVSAGPSAQGCLRDHSASVTRPPTLTPAAAAC
jgi:hypothetical protein